MTTLLAAAVASLAGWLVEAPLRALFGGGTALAGSFAVSAVAFTMAKRFVSELRG